MSGNGDLHSGHRQRMKERFLTNGLEGFSSHEVIELMLFYAIPRRDVNELSHRLIERFGSYNAVFEADYEDLLSVEGIGENAAVLIKFMSAAWRRYALVDEHQPYLYDSLKKIGEYAVRLYVGVSVEKIYAMLFDNKMMLLDTVKLAEGSVNSVRISLRTIIDKAIKKNASSIVLIHNHPNGSPYPSDADIRFTNSIKDLLYNVDINLVDHIIVSGKYYRPIFQGETKENALASSVIVTEGNPFLPDNELGRAASDIPYDRGTEQ